MSNLAPVSARRRSPGVHLTGAQYAVRLFGGVRKLARILHRHPSTISRWSSRNDSVLRIADCRHLLALASDYGYDLSPADMINGREIPDPAPKAAA